MLGITIIKVITALMETIEHKAHIHYQVILLQLMKLLKKFNYQAGKHHKDHNPVLQLGYIQIPITATTTVIIDLTLVKNQGRILNPMQVLVITPIP